MLPVSLVPCNTKLQIDIKGRHGTNTQSITIEIYVYSSHFSPLLGLWLEISFLFSNKLTWLSH